MPESLPGSIKSLEYLRIKPIECTESVMLEFNRGNTPRKMLRRVRTRVGHSDWARSGGGGEFADLFTVA